MKYVVITPVRDEETYLPQTIESMVKQTVRPQQWVIINDGSSDETGRIADRAAQVHHWITVVHRPNRGFRQSGGGVVESFYAGYEVLASPDWQYLVKLDGDLSFGPEYFEECARHFIADSKLGIGGGTICGLVDGSLIEESKVDPPFHVRGATKIYRRECWQAIGGLIQAPGWDTLDEVKANMLGWDTYSFSELKLNHHRYSGNADGAWKNWVKNGRANYITGYHPLFMLLKCGRRVFERPIGLAALGLLVGFLGGYLKRVPQCPDQALVKYLRRQQINRVFLRESLWNSAASRRRRSQLANVLQRGERIPAAHAQGSPHG